MRILNRFICHFLFGTAVLAGALLGEGVAVAQQLSGKPAAGNSDQLPAAQTLHRSVPWRASGPVRFSAPNGAELFYFGGPVISNVHVVQVLWGNGSYLPQVVNTPAPSISSFFSDITNSGFMDLLSQYNTVDLVSTGQTIGHGKFDGQFTIVPSAANNGSTIDDWQIQAELLAQISAGSLPSPVLDASGNVNTIYMIYFPPGKTITQGGSSSCVAGGFCAYHGTTSDTFSLKHVLYGVHPDMQAGSGCDLGCGGSSTFDNYTSVTSHELAEAITDAEVGIATSVGPPLAWYDAVYGEIGDICNGQQGSYVANGTAYTLQLEFSNADSDCVLPPVAHIPMPPSGVSVTPASGSGPSQTFTAVSSDPVDASNITAAYLVILSNNTVPGSGSWLNNQCVTRYEPGTNSLSLYADTGGWLPSVPMGGMGSVSNSQCTLLASGSSRQTSGTNLSVNFQIAFNVANFAGPKQLYLDATNAAGWGQDYATLRGTWTVTPPMPPSGVSVTPASGSGPGQTFTAAYSDPVDASNITAVNLIILSNNTVPGSGSWLNNQCVTRYEPGTNSLFLYADTGGWLPPVTLGGTDSASNSQCTLFAAGSSRQTSGTSLFVNFQIAFNVANFAGPKQLYLDAANAAGWGQDYATLRGTWTVTPPPVNPWMLVSKSGIIDFASSTGDVFNAGSGWGAVTGNFSTRTLKILGFGGAAYKYANINVVGDQATITLFTSFGNGVAVFKHQ